MKVRVIAPESFEKKRSKLLTDEAYEELVELLEEQPEKGDIITGTGGVRKIRVATGKNNKGKSGGARVLYYYKLKDFVLLLHIYAKADAENITQAEKNELKKLVPILAKKYGGKDE